MFRSFVIQLTKCSPLSIYDIALFSYLLAFGHFTSEFLIFGSVKLSAGSLSTFVVSSEFPLSLSPYYPAADTLPLIFSYISHMDV